MIKRIMTAEEFADQKFYLPEAGRWWELVAGETVFLDSPSDEHGNVVLNLSNALAAWIDQTRTGYACFELGVVVQRSPDTVLSPAISYFVTGDRWAEMDKDITETLPALVFEVASSQPRRRSMRERVAAYRQAGIPVVVVLDPQQKRIAIHSGHDELEVLNPNDDLACREYWCCDDHDGVLLDGFSMSVEAIFQQPEWWTGPK